MQLRLGLAWWFASVCGATCVVCWRIVRPPSWSRLRERDVYMRKNLICDDRCADNRMRSHHHQCGATDKCVPLTQITCSHPILTLDTKHTHSIRVIMLRLLCERTGFYESRFICSCVPNWYAMSNTRRVVYLGRARALLRLTFSIGWCLGVRPDASVSPKGKISSSSLFTLSPHTHFSKQR